MKIHPLFFLIIIAVTAGSSYWAGSAKLTAKSQNKNNDYLASKSQEIISDYDAAKNDLLSEYGFSCESYLSTESRYYSKGRCLEGDTLKKLDAVEKTTFTRLRSLLTSDF